LQCQTVQPTSRLLISTCRGRRLSPPSAGSQLRFKSQSRRQFLLNASKSTARRSGRGWKFWEGSIRAGFKDHTFEIVETHADGNLAYVLSTWTVKKVGGGPNNNEESTLQGHTLRVLLKQSDGTWKTKVHIFVPLASPVPQEAKK
jgi:hypothetical protein